MWSAQNRDVDADGMFVTPRDTRSIDFDCGVAESVCDVAGRTVHRTAPETASALVADEPIKGGVDNPPVVSVRFGGNEFGEVEFTFGRPIGEEQAPLLVDDIVDEEPATTTVGRSPVLVATTLLAPRQGSADSGSHPRIILLQRQPAPLN
ncbi:hypothetical protein ACFV24_11955 [Nocardia fluminea]|uniref:hypothetical protein n=1 Tax=Nocardia fluminea TaxID=134984 RepID=UPI00366AE80D